MRIPSSLPTVATFLLAACVAPTTQMATLSPEVVRAEQLKQQVLVIESGLAEQRRLADLVYPMARAAAPLCGKWVTTRWGLAVANLHSWARDYQEAARSLGFTDSLTVVGVAAGSPAARAGIVVGDRIKGVASERAPVGRTAAAEFGRRVTPRPPGRGALGLAEAPMELEVSRATEGLPERRDLSISLPPDTTCAYGSVAVKDDQLNAWADGQQVWVTTAMLRFAATDDELAVVVAHELAHNAMRHIDAKKQNATIGALLGAIVDIAVATQGVNTGGDFANSGAAIGAMSYSQDFEREADVVGLYILARTGRSIDGAPNFWRRMAQESPGSIKYASSHPTSAERFVRLDGVVQEIKRKQEAGEALLPDGKNTERQP